MTVGELYRAIGKGQTVELIQSNTTDFHGNVNDIPLMYMDASVKFFRANYRHPTCDLRKVSPYIEIVLCE